MVSSANPNPSSILFALISAEETPTERRTKTKNTGYKKKKRN